MLIAATALLGAVGGVAHAADSKSQGLDLTVRSDVPTTPIGAKSVKWDAAKGRWGLTLNLEQPDARPSTLNDIQAGAYYRITPALRVGGAVALGDQQITQGPKRITPDEGQPRVRLETAFKF